MSYILDAEIEKDIGDHRYFLSRRRQVVSITRQLLVGNKLDPTAEREDVPEAKIPSALRSDLALLRSGELAIAN